MNILAMKKIRKQLRPIRKQLRPIEEKIRKNMCFPVWLLNGIELNSGAHFAIIYLGNQENKNYIANLAYGEQYDEIYLGEKWLPNIFLMLKTTARNYCMIIIDANESLCRLMKRNRDFYIPSWVHGELGLPLTVSDKSSKNDLRKIRKNNLKYEVTTEKLQFHQFYHDMYSPYMIKRHGNKNKSLNYDELMRYWESGKCELMLIKRENEHVAGEVILFEENGPRLLILGIQDGDPCYLKYGTGAACYHFSAHYLQERGYKSLHLGGSRPFLNDGVLRFKKKLGLRLVGKTDEGFLFKPLSPTAGLRGFLLRNPFIFAHQKELCGAIFIENGEVCSSQKNLTQFSKCFYINGLSNLNIYPLNSNGTNSKTMIGSALANRINILPAEKRSGLSFE